MCLDPEGVHIAAAVSHEAQRFDLQTIQSVKHSKTLSVQPFMNGRWTKQQGLELLQFLQKLLQNVSCTEWDNIHPFYIYKSLSVSQW